MTSIRVLSWNISHGLDSPPNPHLSTWRSRLLRISETDATHVHVNRRLLAEFGERLAAYEWDVVLLQEAPPDWLAPLAHRSKATGGASALTARNFGAPLRRWLAERNPNLIGSHEGGSNQLLVRPPWRIVETRRLTLARRPERRRMLWVRLHGPRGAAIAVANVHLTSMDSPKAGREALRAAAHAVAWTGDDPLIFGGDLNAPDSFRELDERYGLLPEPGPMTIDHLLARGLEIVDFPCALPPEARELPEQGKRLLRLSDHSPVFASFALRVAASPAGKGTSAGFESALVDDSANGDVESPRAVGRKPWE
jgi:Endonuclease/Exonuclease/phosphatase family